MNGGDLRAWAWRGAALAVAIEATRQWAGRRRCAALGWHEPAPSHCRGRITARVLGEGPPILLLHGLGASGRYWGGAYDSLAPRHQLIVPDLLGFGRSSKPELGYTLDDHADALVALLDELGVRKSVVVVAHSAAARLALRLAEGEPARVSAVVAVGPALFGSSESALARVAALGAMARLFANDGSLARATCAWVCAHRRSATRLAQWTRPDLPRAIAGDSVQHTWHSYSGTLEHAVLAPPAVDWRRLADIPVVILAGATDPLCDWSYLRRIEAEQSNVELRVWQGGHDLPLTGAARIYGLVSVLADDLWRQDERSADEGPTTPDISDRM